MLGWVSNFWKLWGLEVLRPAEAKIFTMVIKFSDKFESIFYAVLFNNLTGFFLQPQNAPENLFKDEPASNIDNLDWQKILSEHTQRFGPVKWLSPDNSGFHQFKILVASALRSWKGFKYKAIIDVINQALKYGLPYILNKESDEAKALINLANEVNSEIERTSFSLSFIPLEINNDKFLFGEFNEESQIGDLVIAKLKNRYFGYNLILKTARYLYIAYKDRNLKLELNFLPLEISKDNFAKFWQQFYKDNFLEKNEDAGLLETIMTQNLMHPGLVIF